MKRIVCLMVAVLGSAVVMHAEDARPNSTAGSARYHECVPESENRANCDGTATSTDADAAPVTDGNVFKDAAHNSEPQHMGANMGSTEKQEKQKTEWAPFDYN